jgi:hypothetical protein
MKLKAPFGHTALSAIPAGLDCLCGHSGSFHMKKIPLTRGLFALVDDEDFEYLNQWKWCANKIGNTFYAVRATGKRINNRMVTTTYYMHRILMKPEGKLIIDHINKYGLDNRKENLRVVTKRENSWNKIGQAEFIGVQKAKKRYQAKAVINGKMKHIGIYKTPEEAHNNYLLTIKSLLP